MLMEIFNAVVIVLGVLISLAHFPQAMKIIKTRSSGDISLITYSIFTVGCFVWLIYGFVIEQLPVILSYLIGFFGSGLVLILTIKYR
jgi:MtN3 and saliva related transmembrane protein